MINFVFIGKYIKIELKLNLYSGIDINVLDNISL